MAIVRSFREASMQDILYRQAGLHDLLETLGGCQEEDRESGHPDRIRYDLNWYVLQRSADDDAPEGNDPAQWETRLEFRTKLKEYQEALLRHRKILDLGPPPSRQIGALNEWMKRPDMGDVFLQGSDRDIWKDERLKDDLVALAGRTEAESFTNSFTLWMTHQYHRVVGRRIHRSGAENDVLRNTIRYTNSGTFRVFKALSAVAACLLPIAGIAVLFTIKNMKGRIGAVAAFTFVFSLSLSVITSATVKDIFIATTTFAAVPVVFVGTTDPSSGISHE
ncbi:hypothetical protein QBC35DRAFT_512781 [Podospora australis]|uniref:DUF6594 domain-containing protein n=1 Tax=Podospora australis TaxID=1536484 RepID=A0AAN6X0K5_9PEZI|nr:hypothetical protein QBC35DRAFT_512781 [Podospora australis]